MIALTREEDAGLRVWLGHHAVYTDRLHRDLAAWAARLLAQRAAPDHDPTTSPEDHA